MELQEFIHLTLTQVINGVKQAQETTKETGAKINPGVTIGSGNTDNFYQGEHNHFPLQEIEFDIAIQTENETEAGGTIGVVIASIGAGAKGKMKDTQSSVSRIRFSIPVVFPGYDLAKDGTAPLIVGR
jgi:hypothetical protein